MVEKNNYYLQKALSQAAERTNIRQIGDGGGGEKQLG